MAERRPNYRGPAIVDVGEVEEITTAGSELVREPGSEPPDWYNPNPPPWQGGVGGATEESPAEAAPAEESPPGESE